MIYEGEWSQFKKHGRGIEISEEEVYPLPSLPSLYVGDFY